MSSEMREFAGKADALAKRWRDDAKGFRERDMISAADDADFYAEELEAILPSAEADNGLYGPLTGAQEASMRGYCITQLQAVEDEYPDTGKFIREWLTHVENERNRLFAALLARTEAGADECEVCKGAGTVDEMLGGYAFSNPKATCPECDGLGEYTHPKNAAPVADGLYAWVRESPRHWERVTESDLSQPADPQKMRADRWFPVYTHPHDASAREADRESLLSYKEIVHRLASTREGCIELAKVVHRELDFIDRCITDAIARCEAAAALPSPPKEKEAK